MSAKFSKSGVYVVVRGTPASKWLAENGDHFKPGRVLTATSEEVDSLKNDVSLLMEGSAESDVIEIRVIEGD